MVGRAMETAVRSRALTKVQTRTAMKVSQNAEPLRKPVVDRGEVRSDSDVVVGSIATLEEDLRDICVSSQPVGGGWGNSERMVQRLIIRGRGRIPCARWMVQMYRLHSCLVILRRTDKLRETYPGRQDSLIPSLDQSRLPAGHRSHVGLEGARVMLR